MLSLLELKELLGEDVINNKMDTPHKTILRESGSLVVSDLAIDDDTLLEVYDNGFVLYETDMHFTVFPLRYALADYRYDDVLDNRGHVIPLSAFYEMPWVFRVLIEAEDRVMHSIYTSPTAKNCAPFGTVMEQLLKIRDSSQDVLEIILWKELMNILKRSEHALTEYQRYLIHSIYNDDRSMKEMTKEVETSRHAVEDVIERGLINMRKVFREMGFEIEASLLKYK